MLVRSQHLGLKRMEVVPNGEVGDWRLGDEEFCLTFHLPTAASHLGALARANPFPREERLHFDELTHVYTVDGNKVPRSVTGFLHSFAPDFEAREIAEAMRHSPWWPEKSRKYTKESGEVMTTDEILDLWASLGEVASKRGTLLHYHAEQFLNGRPIEEPHSPEFQQLLEIFGLLRREGLMALRTELSVFHCGLQLAGQIDGLFTDADGCHVIVDWKRCKEIRETCREPLRPPLEHLPACNYFLYALQLNLYAFILESEYGCTVSRLLLGVAHPTAARGRCIELPKLHAEIDAIVGYEVAAGRAAPSRPGPSAPWN